VEIIILSKSEVMFIIIINMRQYEGYWDWFLFSSYDIGDILAWDRGSDLWMPILMVADAQKYLQLFTFEVS